MVHEWARGFLLGFLARAPGIADSASELEAGGRGHLDCPPESARKQPCDHMTHLCPNYFLPEWWLLGRVRALEGSLCAPWLCLDLLLSPARTQHGPHEDTSPPSPS